MQSVRQLGNLLLGSLADALDVLCELFLARRDGRFGWSSQSRRRSGRASGHRRSDAGASRARPPTGGSQCCASLAAGGRPRAHEGRFARASASAGGSDRPRRGGPSRSGSLSAGSCSPARSGGPLRTRSIPQTAWRMRGTAQPHPCGQTPAGRTRAIPGACRGWSAAIAAPHPSALVTVIRVVTRSSSRPGGGGLTLELPLDDQLAQVELDPRLAVVRG